MTTTNTSATTLKFKGQPKIYLNSFVKNAASYYSENIQPVEAEIMEASFFRKDENGNDEEESVITGLWNYYLNRNNITTNTPEGNYIHKKYSGIRMCLTVREKKTHEYANIQLITLDDIADHLMEIGRDELEKLEQQSRSKASKDDKASIDHDRRMWNEKRDSCIPLMGKTINIYRQTVNGHDVIGFSKAYSSSTTVSYNNTKKDIK